jgi:hypothetical protein
MKRLSQGVLLLSNMLALELAAEIPREWWAYGGVERSGNMDR